MSAAASAPSVSGLSADQLAQFRRDGYLVLPDFFSADTAEALKSRVHSMLDSFDLTTHPKTIFKTTSEGRQTASPTGPAAPSADGVDAASSSSSAVSLSSLDPNRYFLDSASDVHFFFEERAFSAEGALVVPKAESINKIGHFLHERDPQFKAFTYRPEVKALAKAIGMEEPVVLQSMVICKQPRIGGEVTPHRDSTFLYTEPSTATGMWFALEDCTASNGCLSFVPGSHKDGSNSKRFGRAESASAPLRPTVNNPGFDSASGESGPNNAHIDLEFTGSDPRLSGYAPSDFVSVPVTKGSCILIDGEVVHQSERNLSALSRFIYTFHLIDLRANTTYSAKNWLQMKQPFPRLNQ